MADHKELKRIAQARLKTAGILIDAEDWDGAAYAMGWTLEVALKAVACKTLRLEVYPEKKHDDVDYFLTHRFDRLIRISGLEYLLGPRGPGFKVWSDFTKEYPGEWPAMRYDRSKQQSFDRAKVEILHRCLTDRTTGSEGILTLLTKKRKW